MKWFRNLFQEEEKVNVYEEVKKKMEQEEREKEKEKQEEPKNMIDVEAVGKYSFRVVDRREEEEDYYHWQYRYYIEFSYDVVANLLGEEIPCKSKFYLHIDEISDDGRRFLYNALEEIYKSLADFIEGKNEYIMEELQDSILKNIREYLRNKNIEKLKEIAGENKEFDIKLSFKVEDDGRYKK